MNKPFFYSIKKKIFSVLSVFYTKDLNISNDRTLLGMLGSYHYCVTVWRKPFLNSSTNFKLFKGVA